MSVSGFDSVFGSHRGDGIDLAELTSETEFHAGRYNMLMDMTPGYRVKLFNQHGKNLHDMPTLLSVATTHSHEISDRLAPVLESTWAHLTQGPGIYASYAPRVVIRHRDETLHLQAHWTPDANKKMLCGITINNATNVARGELTGQEFSFDSNPCMACSGLSAGYPEWEESRGDDLLALERRDSRDIRQRLREAASSLAHAQAYDGVFSQESMEKELEKQYLPLFIDKVTEVAYRDSYRIAHDLLGAFDAFNFAATPVAEGATHEQMEQWWQEKLPRSWWKQAVVSSRFDESQDLLHNHFLKQLRRVVAKG